MEGTILLFHIVELWGFSLVNLIKYMYFIYVVKQVGQKLSKVTQS